MLPRFQFLATDVPTFTGFAFYNAYKDADFLKQEENIVMALSRGYQLRSRLKDLAPGANLVLDGWYISANKPVVIKKSGPGVKVEDHEFTVNRLTGLVAAYAYENLSILPNLVASDAAALGLTWDNTNQEQCKLYLAAVSGTEHFYDQFSFYPLICALRKLRLAKIKPEFVSKIARVKCHDGKRMIQWMQEDRKTTAKMWRLFPGSTAKDFENILKSIDKK